MAVRISHCSTSIENYRLVVEHNVDGFPSRGPEPGDTLYLVVKSGTTTWCGVRYVLGPESDLHPWDKAEKEFPYRFAITQVEFCEPFNVNMLREVERHYPVKYLQRSKEIKEKAAVTLLRKTFDARRTDTLQPIPVPPPKEAKKPGRPPKAAQKATRELWLVTLKKIDPTTPVEAALRQMGYEPHIIWVGQKTNQPLRDKLAQRPDIRKAVILLPPWESVYKEGNKNIVEWRTHPDLLTAHGYLDACLQEKTDKLVALLPSKPEKITVPGSVLDFVEMDGGDHWEERLRRELGH